MLIPETPVELYYLDQKLADLGWGWGGVKGQIANTLDFIGVWYKKSFFLHLSKFFRLD